MTISTGHRDTVGESHPREQLDHRLPVLTGNPPAQTQLDTVAIKGKPSIDEINHGLDPLTLRHPVVELGEPVKGPVAQPVVELVAQELGRIPPRHAERISTLLDGSLRVPAHHPVRRTILVLGRWNRP